MPLPCPSCEATVDAPAAAPASCPACGGSLVVAGRFLLRELLGRGGMSSVYGATCAADGARVAAKILVPRAAGDWVAWDLFERSSRVLKELRHPALPAVHAFGREEPARLVLVREIFDGGTLAERIRTDDRRLTQAQVRRLLTALLELCAYLQSLLPPVVHRDIKPSNIMFRTPGDWDPVLVDFDTIAAAPGQRSGITIVASPGYTAPEQLVGDAGAASDLYSLGATLLFVATHGEPDALPRAHGRWVVAELVPGLAPGLAAVLQRLLEPALAARYAVAVHALRDLAALGPGDGDGDDAPLAVPAPPAPGGGGVPTAVTNRSAPKTEITPPPPAPDSVPPPGPVYGAANTFSVIYGDRRTYEPIGHVARGAPLRLLDCRTHRDHVGDEIVHVQIIGGEAAEEIGKAGWVPLRFTGFAEGAAELLVRPEPEPG